MATKRVLAREMNYGMATNWLIVLSGLMAILFMGMIVACRMKVVIWSSHTIAGRSGVYLDTEGLVFLEAQKLKVLSQVFRKM